MTVKEDLQQLRAGAPDAGAASVRAEVLAALGASLGVAAGEIDPTERFHRYGLDSLRATRLTAELGARLGRSLPATTLWDHPTVDALVDHLLGVETPPRRVAGPTTSADSEPIAIVGLACRLPRAADVRAAWELLTSGVDAISEVPAARWPVDLYFDADASVPGKMSTRWGGFLDQVDRFDAGFFKISPREAAEMDPQQRLALELAWEALQDAGIARGALENSRTGVFFGQMWSDYMRLAGRHVAAFTPHTATGQDTSIIAARISYTLGLSGPSMVVNTACSSALVAVHLACQSLLRGESTLALVGAVSLLLSPETTVLMTKFGAMAKDGRSKAFGSGASGYVRGEGGGVVVLRRLGDALRAGDRIYCVIRGSAVNNDGPSNGLTAPSPAAQEAVLRDAYETAGIQPERVAYVEAHGTGTFLGDTIEAKSLGAVLGRCKSPDQPLYIGSIKSNIGHLEAASGIAGLIKAVLALHHRAIPASLHSRPPNPDIPFDALGLRVPAELLPWPEDGRREPVAGVNSFGFGGTNCHVVLEGSPAAPELFTAQAASDEALREEAHRAVLRLSGPGLEPSLREMCSQPAGPAGGAHRLAVTARTRAALRTQLMSFLEGKESSMLTSGAGRSEGGLVFVYSGHGGQWQGMGCDLLRRYPVFRAAIERCDAALRRWTDVSVMDELLAGKESSRLNVFDVAQTTLFAVQVALGELWRSLGVLPDRVVGHSVGEVAAACFAGILDLDEAARVIFHRSRLGGRNTGTGGMLSVDLPFEEAAKLGGRYGDRFCVGVLNSPTSSVLSGDLDAIEEVARELSASGIRVSHINTSRIAGHCPRMEPLRAELVASLEGLSPRDGDLPIVSTVTAGQLDGGQWGAEYWGRNLRDTVRFAPAIERLAAEGCATFVEIGPHPVVSHAVKATLSHHGRPGRVIASQRRDEDGAALLLHAAGELFTSGRTLPRIHGARGAAEDAAVELLLLSAHTEAALRDLALSTAGALEEPGASPLRDIACTAATRRDHFPHRLAVAGSAHAELAAALRRAVPGSTVVPAARPRIGLFFPAACATSRDLLRPCLELDVLRAALERAERALGRVGGAASSFPVQLAFAALVTAFAGPPAVLSGEGVGRIVAAVVSGELDLDAAAALVRSGDGLPDSAPPAEPPALWLVVGRDTDVPAALTAPRSGEGAERVVALQGDGRQLRSHALAALGTLYTMGASVDGRVLHPGGGHVAPLPGYPFQRERYWLSSGSTPELGAAPLVATTVPSILPRLAPALAGERRAILQSFVAGQVRTTLGFDLARRLDPGAPIREMGLDSMLAVQLRSRLGQGIARDLPATLLFDYPTIDALAGHLEALLFGVRQSREPRRDAHADLSREALEELLSRKLAGALGAESAVPVAVVGIGCRFPGAEGPAAFWQLLRSGTDAIREVPASRWNLQEWYDPDLISPGKMSTRWGGFLEDVAAFDPRFFGLSLAEAARMDPQQRLVLEVAWEALEHAGVAPETIAGTDAGVFIGISALDFPQLMAGIPKRAGTGMMHCIAANRLSYFLDLRGPSVAVDTACSSSLVAVHLAAQSLRDGETNLALAGGVNLILNPEWTASFSEAGMMAADGRCKSFDAAADGYVRGEGCGVVVLRRLPDALRAGDPILAVLRGSAINQDGRSNGLTAPNGLAQQAVLRKALSRAGIEPRDVDYIETHGSGTPLGDAIEVQSLSAVLGPGRAAEQRLLLGSVKTSIGHLESAAGIAGLIKCVLAIHHGEIPPHLHLRNINPHIDLERMPLAIPPERVPWPERGRARIAGVSSFGIGGTNAHVVVEQAPRPSAEPKRPDAGHVLVLSAAGEPELRALAARYAVHLEAHPQIPIASLCATAAAGRAQLAHRLAIRVETLPRTAAALATFARGEPTEGLTTGLVQPGARPKIAFLFTGQGAQHPGMGRALYDTQKVFRSAIDACDALLRGALERPLLDILYGEDTSQEIDGTTFAQPALFAIEHAFAALWRSWGVRPDAVLGHSVGELAAACAAGMMSLEDATRLVAERGRLMGSLPGGGSMVAAFAPEGDVLRAIGELGDRVSIAAINGPKSVVLSGDSEAVDVVCARLEEDFVVTRPMRTSHAFHSARMDPILPALHDAARRVSFREPQIPLVSNLSGGRLAAGETLGADHVRDHARAPVRFGDGMAALAAAGCDMFIEVGPHDTLTAMGKRCLPGAGPTWIASARRGEDGPRVIEEAVARAFVAGAPVDWLAFWGSPRPVPVPLPTYPFERRRCWPDASELRRPHGDEEQQR